MGTEASANSPLVMSDDDFLNAPEPPVEDENTTQDTAATSKDEETTANTSTSEKDDETTSTDEDENTSTETTETDDATETATQSSEETTDTSTTTKTDTQARTDTDGDDDSDDDKSDKDQIKADDASKDADEETTVDYKSEYEKLLTPFKANGRQMQISSVDDAITLMKMGANYNKKMAALKPNLRLMKMLENNDLLDEGKLSYLIDLDKKNPDAIQKFIKESGIDPLELDADKDTDYTPSTYTVNDKEVELDGVLDDIRDTPSFQKTIDIISNKWDASSKKVLMGTPGIIKVINEQVDNGIFAQITDVIESERMLGRLQGLSDLEAYKQVGDAIQAKGGFKVQNSAKATEETTTTVTKKPQDDPKVKDKKRAAATTRSGPSGNKKEDDFNPLSLSDAEFEKMSSNEFI